MKAKQVLALTAATAISLMIAQAGLPPQAEARGKCIVKSQCKYERRIRIGNWVNAFNRGKKKSSKFARLHKRFDPATQALRLKMFAGQQLTEEQLRFLAVKGESLASYHLAVLIQSHGGSADEALFHYAEALAAGRAASVHPMLGILRASGPSIDPDVLTQAKSTLTKTAAKGDADAMVGLSQLYLAGRPFGSDRKAGIDYLISAAQKGNQTAAIQAGLLLSKETGDADAQRKSTEMFQLAAKGGNLVALTMLQKKSAP